MMDAIRRYVVYGEWFDARDEYPCVHIEAENATDALVLGGLALGATLPLRLYAECGVARRAERRDRVHIIVMWDEKKHGAWSPYRGPA
jgi:hypothetical protein